MIGAVMFLGGFFTSLLAFYGRNAPLLMLAVILFAFCWVGHERVHKAFCILPIIATTALAVANWQMVTSYIENDYLHSYTSLLCLLVSSFLLISMIPNHQKEIARPAISFFAIVAANKN